MSHLKVLTKSIIMSQKHLHHVTVRSALPPPERHRLRHGEIPNDAANNPPPCMSPLQSRCVLKNWSSIDVSISKELARPASFRHPFSLTLNLFFPTMLQSTVQSRRTSFEFPKLPSPSTLQSTIWDRRSVGVSLNQAYIHRLLSLLTCRFLDIVAPSTSDSFVFPWNSY